MLAVLLIVGGVVGAQIGIAMGARLRAEQLRILLALLVLAVCGKAGAGPVPRARTSFIRSRRDCWK